MLINRKDARINGIVRWSMLIILVALLGVALAVVLKDAFEDKLTGVIAFGIDQSRSAAAENSEGVGRIERERNIAVALDSFPYAYVAAYGFTDGAFSQSSFSRDHKNFSNTVQYLAAIEAVPGSGSDLGQALSDILVELDAECARFDKKQSCLLVFMSDGENTGANETLFDAMGFAQAKGIKIVAIGVGEKEPVPIPMYDEYGELLGYEKDARGNRYLTKLDEATMQRIALGTGGIYAGENELGKARKFIESNLVKEKVNTGGSNSPLAAILISVALVPFVVYTRFSKN